jgi:putative polyketide hydroxylase
MHEERSPVLVVGGGLAGLTAAVFLAWRGVQTVLVERHASSSAHPRAIGYTPRTVELLRAVGLEEHLPPGGDGVAVRRARVESLAGPWFEEQPWSPKTGTDGPLVEYSPCKPAGIAQDTLEELLRQRARELGAELRYGTELLTVRQDDSGVRAQLRDSNGTYSVHAEYLVAADGHRSPVRTALGIKRSGRGHMTTARSVLFRDPGGELEQYTRTGIGQFAIDQPGLAGFLGSYRDGRWVLMFSDDAERDEATLRELIAKAIGRDDVPVEIITTGRWELSASIADSYAHGRVFLTGDAAHTLPPNRGGYGANLGIEDSHNLAWKLAAVLSGESAPALLDTYEQERRPVASLCYEQLFARTDPAHSPSGTTLVDDRAMVFGLRYASAGIVDEATAGLPPAQLPEQWHGRPGTRAPHVWLERDGVRLSTLDLLQRGWVLLTAGDGWDEAAAKVSLTVERLGDAAEAFGIGSAGASLVRPDGYLAWRTTELPADPVATLTEALRRTQQPIQYT